MDIFTALKIVNMKKQIEAVTLFHKTYGLGVSEVMQADLGASKNNLRFELMKEENEEYLAAVQNDDIVEIADALGDMLYILCGTIIEHGLQDKIEAVFDEIQRSNMSKLGEDGKPIYREDGKVMKGPNYFKPNFEAILKEKV
jgi:predicted HAD superfamily Cof-like phosphohydrolase